MPWNLQVLCAECNRRKGAGYDWRWEERRFRLMHLYFTFGWRYLDNEDRAKLVADARENHEEFSWHSRYRNHITVVVA